MPTLPRLRAQRCILQRMHSQLSAIKSERYLELYSQQVATINQDLEEAAGKLKNVTFWTHNGKCDERNRNIRAKFGQDGIRLSVCGQYQFCKFLRGALASSANRLRNSLSKTKGSETRTGSSENFHEGRNHYPSRRSCIVCPCQVDLLFIFRQHIKFLLLKLGLDFPV